MPGGKCATLEVATTAARGLELCQVHPARHRPAGSATARCRRLRCRDGARQPAQPAPGLAADGEIRRSNALSRPSRTDCGNGLEGLSYSRHASPCDWRSPGWDGNISRLMSAMPCAVVRSDPAAFFKILSERELSLLPLLSQGCHGWANCGPDRLESGHGEITPPAHHVQTGFAPYGRPDPLGGGEGLCQIFFGLRRVSRWAGPFCQGIIFINQVETGCFQLRIGMPHVEAPLCRACR